MPVRQRKEIQELLRKDGMNQNSEFRIQDSGVQESRSSGVAEARDPSSLLVIRCRGAHRNFAARNSV
jgi:hypothetical protein